MGGLIHLNYPNNTKAEYGKVWIKRMVLKQRTQKNTTRFWVSFSIVAIIWPFHRRKCGLTGRPGRPESPFMPWAPSLPGGPYIKQAVVINTCRIHTHLHTTFQPGTAGCSLDFLSPFLVFYWIWAHSYCQNFYTLSTLAHLVFLLCSFANFSKKGKERKSIYIASLYSV